MNDQHAGQAIIAHARVSGVSLVRGVCLVGSGGRGPRLPRSPAVTHHESRITRTLRALS